MVPKTRTTLGLKTVFGNIEKDPEKLREMVRRPGAHSTGLQSPESVDPLVRQVRLLRLVLEVQGRAALGPQRKVRAAGCGQPL